MESQVYPWCEFDELLLRSNGAVMGIDKQQWWNIKQAHNVWMAVTYKKASKFKLLESYLAPMSNTVNLFQYRFII